MGRPKLDAARLHSSQLNVRLTPDVRAAIAAAAARSDLAPTEWARRSLVAALGRPGPVGDPQRAAIEERVLLRRELNRVGILLNQLARAMNSGRAVAPAELTALVITVRDLVADRIVARP